MTLYILGNGFDLAHKLPTAYWDFRTYLKSAHPEFLEAFEEHYDIYPSMSDEAKKEYLWNRFESNLANIDEDSIIESGTSIEMDLESGDVGIEDTLYSYFTNEYQYIQKLSVYLKEWVRTIRIRDCLPRTSKIKDLPYFTLIDNYTDNKNIWTIVVHRDKEKLKLVNSLVTAGIDRKRVRTIPSGEFFDLDDTAAAHRITELRYRF